MTRDIQRDWGWSSMVVSGQWKGKECFSEWQSQPVYYGIEIIQKGGI